MTGSDGQGVVRAEKIQPGSDIQVSIRIVELVASVSDREVSELPQLYSYIDGDALDTLIMSASPVTISFLYDDYKIKIRAEGDIEVLIENI